MPRTAATPVLGSPKWRRTLRALRLNNPLAPAALLLSILAIFFIQQVVSIRNAGLSGGSLLEEADVALTLRLQELARASPYVQCNSTELRPKGDADAQFAPTSKVLAKLKAMPHTAGAIKGNTFVELLIKDAPCWARGSCCEHNTFVRVGVAPDHAAFRSVFQTHELATLYAVFSNYTPKYILDAGTGPGFTSQLFKTIFPRAVLVSLEADPGNFENLMLNTRETDGVHTVHGGLWSGHATLRARRKKGHLMLSEEAALKSRKAGRKAEDIIGLPVTTIAAMFDIPAFDFVYLDVEGAESVVFGAGADLRWLSGAKVIALKLHTKLGKYFGEKHLVSRVSAAFAGRDFHVVVDDSHVILVAGELVPDLMLRPPSAGLG